MTGSDNNNPLTCPMCEAKVFEHKGEIQGFQYLQCIHCELVFCPKITTDYLKNLYLTGFHGPEEGAPKRGWKKDISFLDPAFQLLPGNKSLKILDFGTGQDRTPEQLRAIGHRVIAVDITSPLRPHPDRLTGDILELNLKAAQFDLVYSYQVFEHLPNPRQIMERLLDLTKPDGLILLHTDMETEERHREGFQNWWYVMPPDHCTLFSHKTFEKYSNSTGNPVIWKDDKRVVIRRQPINQFKTGSHSLPTHIQNLAGHER